MKRILAKVREILKPRRTFSFSLPVAVIKVGILYVLLGVMSFTAARLWDSDIPEVIRDAVMVVYAHEKAGDKVPFDADNNLNKVYESGQTWTIKTNSIWLLEHVTLIAPFMSYEGLINSSNYPVLAAWAPTADSRSLHVLGWAQPEQGFLFLNERMLNDNRWNDERMALSTFVHELIHLQIGAFSTGTSEELESATSAATVEVLAALCNYGDDLACQSYWSEVEDLAGASLNVRLNENGLGWVYDLFANIFLRDSDREQVVRKSLRFWASHPDELEGIRKRYGQHPWEAHVIPGICGGRLDTRNLGAEKTESGSTRYYILGMKFDDSKELMGLLSGLLCGVNR